MRTATATAALGITLFLAGVTACADEGGTPPPPSAPRPSGTPVFASDEEALAVAEEVYGRFREIADNVGKHGWSDASPLGEVLTDPALRTELESAAELAALGYELRGLSRSDSMTLQRLQDLGSARVSMTLYVCDDLSGVDVVDSEGNSVVAPDRPDRQPLEVEMSDADGTLKISRREAWTGGDFC